MQNALHSVAHYIRPSVSTMHSSNLIQTIDGWIKFIARIKSEPYIVELDSRMMHYTTVHLCTTPSPNPLLVVRSTLCRKSEHTCKGILLNRTESKIHCFPSPSTSQDGTFQWKSKGVLFHKYYGNEMRWRCSVSPPLALRFEAQSLRLTSGNYEVLFNSVLLFLRIQFYRIVFHRSKFC